MSVFNRGRARNESLERLLVERPLNAIARNRPSDEIDKNALAHFDAPSRAGSDTSVRSGRISIVDKRFSLTAPAPTSDARHLPPVGISVGNCVTCSVHLMIPV